MAARWYSRALRPPPDDIVPNPNDPLSVPPSTVGPDQLVTPGDPNGVVLQGDSPPAGLPPTIWPSAWSGWPADWWTPAWNGRVSALSDVAWGCINTNADALASMPPYLVGAAPSLSTDWLGNPSPEFYNCWDEFAKDLFWSYQAAGEAFLLATARYATGYPARFHVVPAWMVTVELDQGYRVYRIGDERVPAGIGPGSDLLHLPYKITTDTARGQGPLDAGASRLVAAETLTRYATQLASGGGIPHSILKMPGEGNAQQAAELKAQWVQARLSSIGEPAVLAGGIEWEPTQVNPKDMALVELQQLNESMICSLLKVPPYLMNLPTPSSMTYANVNQIFEFHWRNGLRPMANTVMGAMSNWLLPRGTRVELNRDAYIEPEPLQRAQTAQILNSIVDPATGQPALSVSEIRAAFRLDDTTPTNLTDGVLRG